MQGRFSTSARVVYVGLAGGLLTIALAVFTGTSVMLWLLVLWAALIVTGAGVERWRVQRGRQ
jgi:hypothetical protein